MKTLNHFKEYLLFWKPTVARKFTLYFALFGLLVFYLTSVGYLITAKNHLVDSVTRIVQGQLPRLPDRGTSDFWWRMVDQKQPELAAMAQSVSSLASATHNVGDIYILGRHPQDGSWHKLYLADEDLLQSLPTSHPDLKKLEAFGGSHLVESGTGLYMIPGNIVLLVNITSPADGGQYFFKVVIARQGLLSILGARLPRFIAVSLVALILFRLMGYFFAHPLAKPIKTLSDAAEKVAQGDLTPQVPDMGETEIGDLGRNFNKMIMGLREWQRMKQIEFELEKGRKIQKDFLPDEIPNLPNWEIATCFYPAREVSGDFYDVFKLPGGKLGLVIADVADKGVGSALYMALIRSLIRVYAEQTFAQDSRNISAKTGNSDIVSMETGNQEIEVVQLANNYLVRHHGHEGMFATLFFGVLDPASGYLVYINGGHEPLYIVGNDGVKEELPPTGPAVGLMENLNFNAQRLQLAPGDLLFGLTDGVTEACNPTEELFTRTRVKDILAQPVASARDLIDSIRQQVFDFADTAPRSDDITMLAIQRMA